MKSSQINKTQLSVVKNPHYLQRSIISIEQQHNSPQFTYHLKAFFNIFLEQQIGLRNITHLDICNHFHIQPPSLQGEEETAIIVKAMPKSKKNPHGRFDTVVVINSDQAESTGLEGT